MKRLLILLLAVLLLRVEHTAVDISALEPVELLEVTEEAGMIRIRTDTGSSGVGADLGAALEDLNAGAAAVVFPDTADFLVVDDAGARLLPELAQILRPACRICRVKVSEDLEAAASWLKLHPPQERLLDHIS